jgi:hypothetical protein
MHAVGLQAVIHFRIVIDDDQYSSDTDTQIAV